MEEQRDVSIHAPREGCDFSRPWHPLEQGGSIHAPREGCDWRPDNSRPHPRVSIHAPREGCDCILLALVFAERVFQFTHPGRGATLRSVPQRLELKGVSIHAPREGCDIITTFAIVIHYVSIHAPREGCDFVRWDIDSFFEFQFTHPGRGATTLIKCSQYGTPCFNSRTPGGVRLLKRD